MLCLLSIVIDLAESSNDMRTAQYLPLACLCNARAKHKQTAECSDCCPCKSHTTARHRYYNAHKALLAHSPDDVQVAEGLNDTAETFMASIGNDESETAPSSIYAAASILEGVPFINGSPQNTFVPGLIEMAIEKGEPLASLVSAQSQVMSHCLSSHLWHQISL